MSLRRVLIAPRAVRNRDQRGSTNHSKTGRCCYEEVPRHSLGSVDICVTNINSEWVAAPRNSSRVWSEMSTLPIERAKVKVGWEGSSRNEDERFRIEPRSCKKTTCNDVSLRKRVLSMLIVLYTDTCLVLWWPTKVKHGDASAFMIRNQRECARASAKRVHRKNQRRR